MRSAFETGDWEVCLQFQAEETSVSKDHTKKGLDRRLKIWEHMQTEIWSRHTGYYLGPVYMEVGDPR